MLNEALIQKQFNKIKSLKQYSNTSEEELWEIAKKKIVESDPDLQIDFVIDKKERQLAKVLVARYLHDYDIESISDKNLIKQIIYLEIVQIRIQDSINDLHKENTKHPSHLIESLQKNLEAILKAKNSLGLTKEKQDANKNDGTKAWELLKRKTEKWQEENQGCRTAICPHCSQMILFKIRVDKYDASKHPYFKDKILYNEHLIALYKEGKLQKSDVAKVLGTSEDYIGWVIQKVEKGNDGAKSKMPI